MDFGNIWDLSEEERNKIFAEQMKYYSEFMALPDEEREKVYYSNFINAISSYPQERQEVFKEEYKQAYEEMIAQRERIIEEHRIEREKNPDNKLFRSYGNSGSSGNFLIFWGEKRVVFRAD